MVGIGPHKDVLPSRNRISIVHSDDLLFRTPFSLSFAPPRGSGGALGTMMAGAANKSASPAPLCCPKRYREPRRVTQAMTACSGLNAPETMDRSMCRKACRSTGLPAGRAVWRPSPVLRLLVCHRRWYRCLSSCRCLPLPRGLSPSRRRGTSRPWLSPGPRAPACYSSRTVMTSVLPIWARVRSNYRCLAKGATSALRPSTTSNTRNNLEAQPSCIIANYARRKCANCGSI